MRSDLRDGLVSLAADLRALADRREAALPGPGRSSNDAHLKQRLWLADSLRDYYATVGVRGSEIYERLKQDRLASDELHRRLELPITPRTRSPRSALNSFRALARELERVAIQVSERPRWYRRLPLNHKVTSVLLAVGHPFVAHRRMVLGGLGAIASVVTIYVFFFPNLDSREQAAAQCRAVADEVAATRAGLERRGLLVSSPALVGLHPLPTNVTDCSTNSLARVLVLQREQPSNGQAELRVYDVTDGRLHLAYRFIPESNTPPPSVAIAGNSSMRRLSTDFIIRITHIGLLPDGIRHYLIFDLEEDVGAGLWPRPMLLTWDERTSKYKVEALLSPSTTGLRTMRSIISTKNAKPEQYAASVIKTVYSAPTIVENIADHTKYATYAVEGYVAHGEAITLGGGPNGQGLTGLAINVGYIIDAPTYATTRQIEVITWHFDLRDPSKARRTPAFALDVAVSDENTPIAEILGRLPLP